MRVTHQSVPEEDVSVNNAVWFELEEKAQSMETQCMLKMTFSEKHQQQPQHSEEGQEDKPHDQIQALDPTTSQILNSSLPQNSIPS